MKIWQIEDSKRHHGTNPCSVRGVRFRRFGKQESLFFGPTPTVCYIVFERHFINLAAEIRDGS